MGIKKVKAISLILDWNLWPRQSVNQLDQVNISRMKAALKNGFTLPPVIVNESDNRVVDGFHRTTAILSYLGDDAEIEVDYRKYKNEAEMFLDAGRLNAHHGMPMNSKDRAHFIHKCRQFKVPPAVIAEALHINPESMKKFVTERIAYSGETGETIALAAGASNLAGKKLNEVQEHFARHASGCKMQVHLRILINAMKADAIIWDESTLKDLAAFCALGNAVLDEVA